VTVLRYFGWHVLSYLVTLEAASSPLSRWGSVRLRWSFFLLSLFFLISLKFMPTLSKNNYVILFLFFFRCFFKFSFFFSNSSLSILFHLIFLSNLVPLLLIALFLCFILFLIIIVLQFCPLTFYCIHFLIQFWSSFFWLLYSYLFLNSSSFFFYFFLQHLISFDVLSNFGPHSLDNCFYPFRSLFFFQFNP
jgi:hypothetical protein